MKITDQTVKNRRKWLRALRSGDYKQTRHQLHIIYGKNSGYCCLGVACEVSGLGEWDGEQFLVGDRMEACGLPAAVAEWLGMTDKQESKAANLNDMTELSFSEIADQFERKWRRI